MNGVDCLVLTKSDVLCGVEIVKFVYGGNLYRTKGWEHIDSDSFNEFLDTIVFYTGCKDIAVSSGPKEHDWYIPINRKFL